MPPTVKVKQYRLFINKSLFSPHAFPFLPAVEDLRVHPPGETAPQPIDEKNRPVPRGPNTAEGSAALLPSIAVTAPDVRCRPAISVVHRLYGCLANGVERRRRVDRPPCHPSKSISE